MAWLYITGDASASVGLLQVADESVGETTSNWYYVGGGTSDTPRGEFTVLGSSLNRVHGIPHFAYSEGTLQHKKMRVGCETLSRTWTDVFVELSKVIE